MPMEDKMQVLSQRQLTKNIYELVLKGQLVEQIEEPGQFVQLLIPDASFVLRRPISIAFYNKKEQTLGLIYRQVGKGTEQLTHLRAGDALIVFGPLGHGFPLKNKKTALLVGGGVGIPPLYELACQLKDKGTDITMLMGVATQEELFYQEAFSKVATVHIASDDGSIGKKGHVGKLLAQLELSYFDIVYSCGPKPMLQCVASTFSDKVDVYLSLEERMACGIGACYGCVVKQKNKEAQWKVCSDGPVFLAGEVEL